MTYTELFKYLSNDSQRTFNTPTYDKNACWYYYGVIFSQVACEHGREKAQELLATVKPCEMTNGRWVLDIA